MNVMDIIISSIIIGTFAILLLIAAYAVEKYRTKCIVEQFFLESGLKNDFLTGKIKFHMKGRIIAVFTTFKRGSMYFDLHVRPHLNLLGVVAVLQREWTADNQFYGKKS